MSIAFPDPSRAAFNVAADTQFDAAGFMVDEKNRVFLLLSHTTSSVKNHHSTTHTSMSLLSLGQMEYIAQGFRAQHASDDEIFSAAPEAVAQQKSLGYVCYQMLRRLQRVEADWMQHKTVDYTRPLAIKDIEEMIRLKSEGAVANSGFLREACYADVRASMLPVASSYDIQKYKNQPAPTVA